MLHEIMVKKSLYLSDYQKYFEQENPSEVTLNEIIVELSKHTLYFYLYPIFLYSIAKKTHLSSNDFKILQDSGLLGSANMEEFSIVSDFYRDLGKFINKEKNMGNFRVSSLFFHIRQWTIPVVSSAAICIAFAMLFRFPMYFALLGVTYTILYILSEFFLSYKLRLARALTGYAMILFFFLLGGFNLNYQQVATERLVQASNILHQGSGALDIEKAMVGINSLLG